MTNDNVSKQNNLLISNNSNQTQNIINNDYNKEKMEISNKDNNKEIIEISNEDNNKEKKEISNVDNKIIDNLEEPIKKPEIKYSMIIQSNFKSANSQYIKSNNTLTSNKSKQEKILKEKEKGNEYLNKDKEILNPLIHFTNLSSKKLKILGSSSKSKTGS